jgi:hypothetical protein
VACLKRSILTQIERTRHRERRPPLGPGVLGTLEHRAQTSELADVFDAVLERQRPTGPHEDRNGELAVGDVRK